MCAVCLSDCEGTSTQDGVDKAPTLGGRWGHEQNKALGQVGLGMNLCFSSYTQTI